MLPYRSFVKVSSTSQVSSREVYPFQQIRYSFLQKIKLQRTLVCVCGLKLCTRFCWISIFEWRHLLRADVLFTFPFFACSLKLFPLDSKGQVLFFSSVDFPWNLPNWEHLGSDRSLQNAFVCPPSWIPKFTRPPFKPLTGISDYEPESAQNIT